MVAKLIRLFILLIFILFCINISRGTRIMAPHVNYCNASLCRHDRKHIACGNNGRLGPQCPANARTISLKIFKRLILKLHNSRRNKIAGGKMKKFKAAKRMATMQWDENLASLATLNIKRCVMKHDQCRNTNKYKNSGQNVAAYSYSAKGNTRSDTKLIKDRILAWWKEHKNANMKVIKKFPKKVTGAAIGHFTSYVRESQTHVGCGAVRYTKNGRKYFIITCNYATTNIIGKPIYASGKVTSGCKTGRNKVYNNICSKTEKYSQLSG